MRRQFPVRRRVVARFVRALLLCSSLTTVAMNAAPASALEPSQVFFQYNYNSCDARILSHYWNVDFIQAKVMAGEKLLAGLTNELAGQMVSARDQWKCDWEDTNFSYEDAVTLSQYWGTDVDVAKLKVVEYVSRGNEVLVNSLLGGGD